MLYSGSTRNTMLYSNTGDNLIAICIQYRIATTISLIYILYVTCSIINRRFTGIDQIPTASFQIVTFVLQGRLSQNDTKRMFTDSLVVCQGILQLPRYILFLVVFYTGMQSIVIARKIETGSSGFVISPKAHIGTITEMILQFVP